MLNSSTAHSSPHALIDFSFPSTRRSFHIFVSILWTSLRRSFDETSRLDGECCVCVCDALLLNQKYYYFVGVWMWKRTRQMHVQRVRMTTKEREEIIGRNKVRLKTLNGISVRFCCFRFSVNAIKRTANGKKVNKNSRNEMTEKWQT